MPDRVLELICYEEAALEPNERASEMEQNQISVLKNEFVMYSRVVWLISSAWRAPVLAAAGPFVATALRELAPNIMVDLSAQIIDSCCIWIGKELYSISNKLLHGEIDDLPALGLRLQVLYAAIYYLQNQVVRKAMLESLRTILMRKSGLDLWKHKNVFQRCVEYEEVPTWKEKVKEETPTLTYEMAQEFVKLRKVWGKV